ncbi:MAG: nicotinate-nucleotide--dimethylbenzimidazole phosphoribosyltransferase [Acidimicrobiaceae bacterium]|nr:nicotinate-nucleotide--dimethylbenzimidazole phosphoribosyltransferase [Acidimicrobiaceae bacterium]MCY4176155.1 nicotinate-nucleotide--dimethylbenzimidazole phosphoribosyltransferase [Acidimicrobiaceae bacterium]MCY4280393.1 nicotinate-nucleotide--dimethylbenzimidazole phosphoribosyltransferase [Acidimicrobiaceae bacterium]MCY4294358.1 nicotinate-nucleotide--dimethylbenzimidazole phosphoribosyltransferase [Acidimicrobiaceae bacterium]
MNAAGGEQQASAHSPGGLLAALLQGRHPPDAAASAAVADRAADVLRPQGAFARLDAAAGWLAGWQGATRPQVRQPHVIVFAADHGVAEDGVSAYPQEVTASIAAAIEAGVATVSVLARQVGATLDLVDVGIGRPTANIRVSDAMSLEEFDLAVAAGADAVASVQADLLIVGEIGIANTTAAAAVAAAVLGGSASDWVGPGSGVAGAALAHKCDVVAEALERVGAVTPLQALRRLGGRELAAMAGAVAEARRRRLPVILDGFIATAAVAPLAAAEPGSLDHCLAGHCSAEPGHQRALQALGLDPLMRLDLRLGEGSGALLAVPLVRMAAACVTEVATFSEWGLEAE